jgi:hypothetical protein
MELSISILILFLIIYLFNRYLKNNDNGIKLYEDNFTISGMYGLTINYKDICQIDMIFDIPEIGMRTNGYYLNSVCKGYFILKDIGNVYLNLNLKYPPYIRILLENDGYIFINLSNEKDTTELYDNLLHVV